MDQQRKLILDQFTQQAVPFAEKHGRDDDDFYQLIIRTGEVTREDTVLDVACGPGLVACAVARDSKHVTGIDLTPAMIDQARQRQQSLGLTNLTWVLGDAHPLPFPDNAFTRVITRYSFHHFTAPKNVFAEMVRVCSGRITVCDVYTTSAEQAEGYDRLERYRDPSHTHALQLTELAELFAGLTDIRREFYQYPVQVEDLLSRSFPEPGGADAFRRIVEADIGVEKLGLHATREGELGFVFPVVCMSGVKRA